MKGLPVAEGLQRFLEAVRSISDKPDDELTPLDLAEVLWLAQKIGRSGSAKRSTGSGVMPARPEFARLDDRSPRRVAPRDLSGASSTDTFGDVGEEAESSIYSRQAEHGSHGESELAIRAPGAPGLPGTLRIARAMRPLMKRAASRTHVVLDEVATAERFAEERITIPVMRAVRARWLSMAFIVDRGGASRIWSRTIEDLKAIFDRHGAFSDVRAWELATVGERVQVRPFGSREKHNVSPRELIDTSHRRLFIVISDCVSEAWSDGRITKILAAWTPGAPVAIFQLLPRDLWDQCALRFATAVSLRPPAPATPNASLIVERRMKLRPFRESGFVVPVATLETTRIAEWAQFVAAAGGSRMSGFLFRRNVPAEQASISRSQRAEQWTLPAAARVVRFDSTATREAQALARMFAASPYPLTLPVMRLIQHRLLPKSEVAAMAEVILGGLFEVHNTKSPDPEEWIHEFIAGVRDSLLDAASVITSVDVIRVVSSFVSDRFGQSIDFAALLGDPTLVSKLSISNRNAPLARLGASILRRLGGRYAELAERLEIHLRESLQRTHAVPTGIPAVVPHRAPPEKVAAWQKSMHISAPGDFLVEQLPLIEKVVYLVGRRTFKERDDIAEFSSVVKLRFVENDFAIIRAFRGESTFSSYVQVVVKRLLLQYQRQEWGQWRVSAQAARAGQLARRLEVLLHRDQRALDEALAILAPEYPDATRESLETLSRRFPSRLQRKKVDLEEAAGVAAPDAMRQAEREQIAARVSRVISTYLRRLSADDRLPLQLRFETDMTVSQITRVLHIDESVLYRRFRRMYSELREALHRAGIGNQDVADLIGSDLLHLDFQLLRKRGPSGDDSD